MALALNPRAERLLARIPRFTVYSALELLLLVLLAVQCARLFWALLTPLGPIGEWKDLDAMRPAPAPSASLVSFDPFFRQAPGGPGAAPVVVTTLNIRLTGVREDRATGRGTAFITLANGTGQSFIVGEEIEPGVVLTAVNFDHVVITRGGATEQLFLDQSPAGAAPAPGSPPQNVPPGPPPPVQQQPVIVTPVPAPPPPQAPPAQPRVNQ